MHSHSLLSVTCKLKQRQKHSVFTYNRVNVKQKAETATFQNCNIAKLLAFVIWVIFWSLTFYLRIKHASINNLACVKLLAPKTTITKLTDRDPLTNYKSHHPFSASDVTHAPELADAAAMADAMNVGVNLEAFSQAINAIQALRSSVTRVFDSLKDGMKNKETLEGREKVFITEFQDNLQSVNRDLKWVNVKCLSIQ